MSRVLAGRAHVVGAAVLAVLAACSGSAAAGFVPPPSTPPAPVDPAPFVAATDGDMPLVLVAPHGGALSPADLPDRDCAACVTVTDANTRELAEEIAAAFQRRIAHRPFVVANLLHRRKFDANRELAEATNGYAPLHPVWFRFHEAVDSAKVRARRVHPRALVIDLHGHGHAIARLELGYLLSATDLRRPDSLLSPLLVASSIAGLDAAAASGDRGVALVRGGRALGTRFAAAGVPAVPSATDAAPAAGDAFFSGGYNTGRHGSAAGGAVDAVQIESHFTGVRDTAASRAAFAEVFVTVLLQYLADHYGWAPA